jgi:3-hydroxyacyl-CoA dehydrogenase/enoyl-CoA hydratase/3-hydroxybutyryl-CoA epimerase
VLDFTGFRSVGLVVEAIVEKMEVKKQVFKELEAQVSDECVIASNTSSLSISEMQSVLTKPERFVGMHFFNPVHKMPLIEIIRGARTSDQAVATTFQFSKDLGKTPIVVKDAPGFLVNRLLAPYMNESLYLLLEGVPVEEIDRALLNFGMPMGPMELLDEVGIDVGEKVSHILHAAFGARMQPPPGDNPLVKAGRLGKKTGKGIYQYEGREKSEDPSVYEILGVKPRPGAVPEAEIVERCILPMINEASRCLEEKIVESPAVLDLGMIMGTGFPPFRGGLLRHADSMGARTLVGRLSQYEHRYGARFAPAPPLKAMADAGQEFYRD